MNEWGEDVDCDSCWQVSKLKQANVTDSYNVMKWNWLTEFKGRQKHFTMSNLLNIGHHIHFYGFIFYNFGPSSSLCSTTTLSVLRPNWHWSSATFKHKNTTRYSQIWYPLYRNVTDYTLQGHFTSSAFPYTLCSKRLSPKCDISKTKVG